MLRVFFKTAIMATTTLILFSVAFAQGTSSGIDGQYRLDEQRSEDISKTVESLDRSYGLTETQKDELSDQLAAPSTISISVSGSDRVTLQTSSSPEVTLNANGQSQSVGGANLSATLRNDVLRIAIVSNDASQTMTFRSEGNSSMKVTKTVTTSYLNETVYADSYYQRTGDFVGANRDDDDDFSSSDPDDDVNSRKSTNRRTPKTRTAKGRFVVPKGTVITGALENKITTKASQENDPFSMKVDGPSEYRGAIIEGYITGVERTGRVSGSARLTLNFETIKLRSGEVYDFAGVLQSVTDSTGRIVDVGEEGEAKSKSRTKESVKRGGIGAGLGAIIGGILGGGKGAVIGATIGGGAGAGSVIAEGREDIELLEGSTIKVESTSPSTTNR